MPPSTTAGTAGRPEGAGKVKGNKTVLPPMGDKKVDPGDEYEKVTNATWHKYFKKLPTFETWCAVTMFDPKVNEPRGGQEFHNLMHWLLVEDVTDPRNKEYEQFLNKTVNTVFDHKFPRQEDEGQERIGADPTDPRSMYVHETAYTLEGHTAASSPLFKTTGNNRHPYYFGPAKNQKQENQQQNVTGIGNVGAVTLQMVAGDMQPMGTAVFLETAGMSGTGGDRLSSTNKAFSKCDGGNMDKTFVSGFTKESMSVAGEGCAYVGARLAAYFGLYYYPDCNLEKFNWVDTVTVYGKKFKVRQRLPNPAYTRNGEAPPYVVTAREPAYNYTPAQLKKLNHKPPKSKYYAGNNGIVVPMQELVLPVEFLCRFFSKGADNTHGFKCMIGPFAGEHNQYQDEDVLNVDSNYERNNKQLLDKLHDKFRRIAERNEHTYFGWRVPSAMWLCHEDVPVTYGKPVMKAHEGSQLPFDAYVDWPNMKKDYTQYDGRLVWGEVAVTPNKSNANDPNMRPIAHILDLTGQPKSATARAKFALRIDMTDEERCKDNYEYYQWAYNSREKPEVTLTIAMIIKQLKAYNKKTGNKVPTSGNKAVLLERLNNLPKPTDPEEDDGTGVFFGGAGPPPAPESEEEPEEDDSPEEDDGAGGAAPPPAPESEEEEDADVPAVITGAGDNSGVTDTFQNLNPEENVDEQNQTGADELRNLEDVEDELSELFVLTEEQDSLFEEVAAPKDKESEKQYQDRMKVELLNQPRETATSGAKQVKNGNYRFIDSRYQPWSRAELYRRPEMQFNLRAANQDDIDNAVKKYGSAANLVIQRSEPSTFEEQPVTAVFGTYHTFATYLTEELGIDEGVLTENEHLNRIILKESIWPDKVLEYPQEIQDLFERNLRKIVSIYFDDTGSLGLVGEKISPSEKQALMDGKKKAKFKGVFKSATKTKVAQLKKLFTKSVNGKNSIFFDSQGYSAYNATPVPDDVKAIVNKDCTVLDWVSSPFHLETLPLQEMGSTFGPDETYCAGCTRCSRPFYEYKYHYSPLVVNPKEATFAQNSYEVSNNEEIVGYKGVKYTFQSGVHAALPFHHDAFWSDKCVPVPMFKTGNPQAQVGEGVVDDLERVGCKGFHNWETHAFLLGFNKTTTGVKTGFQGVFKQGMTFGGLKDNPLQREFVKRAERHALNQGLNWFAASVSKNLPFVYRQYLNHVYDPDVNYSDYILPIQGMIRTENAKVPHFRQNYRLSRAAKYGNVCRDCAFALSYVRLYRTNGMTSGAAPTRAKRNKSYKDETDKDTYWLQMRDTVVNYSVGGKSYTMKFDPWFIYLQTSGLRPPVGGNEPDVTFTVGGKSYESFYGRPGSSRRYVRIELGLPKTPMYDSFNYVKGDYRSIGMPLKLEKLWGKNWHVIYEAHLKAVLEARRQDECTYGYVDGKLFTKVRLDPNVFVQKAYLPVPNKTPNERQKEWDIKSRQDMDAAIKVLDKIRKWCDESFATFDSKTGKLIQPKTAMTSLTLPPLQVGSRSLHDALTDAKIAIMRSAKVKPDNDNFTVKYDPDLERQEMRNETITWGKKAYRNSLLIKTLKKPNFTYKPGYKPAADGYHFISYLYDKARGEDGGVLVGNPTDKPQHHNLKHTWQGDTFVVEEKQQEMQFRKHQQTRVMITYSFHRRVDSELEARLVMERMAMALRFVFGNDQQLCKIILFGQRLKSLANGDFISKKQFEVIDSSNKKGPNFYGKKGISSYLYDTYEAHIDSVGVDVGVEIGPTHHYPHFHALLTINHFSYIHIDAWALRSLLESLFKREGPYQLIGGDGKLFYTDNEQPYIKIDLKATDNFQKVLTSYISKSVAHQLHEGTRAQAEG